MNRHTASSCAWRRMVFPLVPVVLEGLITTR